jgi:excisionase family DNA binding protein
MSDSATAILPTSGWMTLQAASELLGVHTNTVPRWVHSGAIRSYRTLGGHRRLAQHDVPVLTGEGAQAIEAEPEKSVLDSLHPLPFWVY